MTAPHSDRRPGRIRRLPMAIVLVGAAVSACSSGPADFVDLNLPVSSVAPVTDARTKTDAQKAALERDLAATGSRQIAAGNAADAGLPSTMALTVIRQQQSEEARALLLEAGMPPACSAPGAAGCPKAP